MPDETKKNIFDTIIIGVFSVILVVNSLVITLLVMGAALARYIFKVNFYGYDEIVVLVAFWFYFAGAAYGAYNNTHVSADVVDAYIPESAVKRILTLFRWFLTCVACGFFVYYGLEYFHFGYFGPNNNPVLIPRSMVWRIPHWTSRGAILMGLVFMELYFLRNLVLSAGALVRGKKA